MTFRTIAIDWSGAVAGAERKIWLAEASHGTLVRLENGRSREALTEHLIAEASRTPELVVGPVLPWTGDAGIQTGGDTDRPRKTRPLEPDEWRVLVRTMLPAPIHEFDELQLVGGDPEEVSVVITPDTISVAACCMSHDRYAPFPLDSEVARFDRETAQPADVARAIARARGKRLATYRWCRFCQRMQPPESMHDEEICRLCATVLFGVLY